MESIFVLVAEQDVGTNSLLHHSRHYFVLGIEKFWRFIFRVHGLPFLENVNSEGPFL